MVIGPLLQPTLNTSAEAILKLINGMWLDELNFLQLTLCKYVKEGLCYAYICLREYPYLPLTRSQQTSSNKQC